MSVETETLPVEPPVETAEAPAAATPPPAYQGGSLLSDAVNRQLRSRQAAFGQALAARLTTYLRADVSVRVSGVQAVSFARFIDRLATPTHVTLLNLEPWRGMGVLEMPPNIALRIVDCQLGGAGRAPDPDRQLTEIEIALLDQVGQMWFDEWRASWPEVRDLKPVLLGHEIDARFLNAIPRETMLLELSYELSLNEKPFPVRFGFPLAAFDPLFRAWEQAGDSPQAGAAVTSALSWNPALDAVPVAVSAGGLAARLPARQLAGLNVGDTIAVDAAVAHAIEVRVGGAVKFTGILGQRGGRWAVQLTQSQESK